MSDYLIVFFLGFFAGIATHIKYEDACYDQPDHKDEDGLCPHGEYWDDCVDCSH